MTFEDAVVEPQTPGPGRESDVLFMEDRRPLHGRAVQGLTLPAMTDFGIDRLGADFVPYGTTMASGSILRDKVFVVR